MSRARHKKADGGRTSMWVSGNPDVEKEAKGEEGYAKGDEKKHGGKVKVKVKAHHRMHGGAVKARADRPGRKRGGAVGADKTPFSSAHTDSGDGHELPRSSDTYGGMSKE